MMNATAERIVAEEPAERLFSSEIILPVQFLDRTSLKPSDRPEKRLMLAVLEEAVATFQRYVTAKNRRGQRLFQEAEDWIRSTDADWPFNFENVCGALEIEPEYLRRGLEAWKQKQRQAGGGAQIYRFPFRRVNGRRSSITLRSSGLRETA